MLRLLFAKINSVSSRVYKPPQSAASDPGARSSDDVVGRREYGSGAMALPSSIAGLVKDDEPGLNGPFGLTAGDDDDGGYDDGDGGDDYGY